MNLHPKVQNTALVGAVATIVLWVVKAYTSIDPPAEIIAAVMVVLGGATGWVTRSGDAAP